MASGFSIIIPVHTAFLQLIQVFSTIDQFDESESIHIFQGQIQANYTSPGRIYQIKSMSVYNAKHTHSIDNVILL